MKVRLSSEEKRIRREIRMLRVRYRYLMDTEILDGSVEEVVIARSKIEACNEILKHLEEVRR